MSRALSPMLDRALAENGRALAAMADAMPSSLPPEGSDQLAIAAALTRNAAALRRIAALYFRTATLNDLAAAELLEREVGQ